MNSSGGTRRARSICKLYLQKKCPHGKTGRLNGACGDEHPRLCFRYLKMGKGPNGCNRGGNCKYYHPRLCWQYSKRGQCNKQDCQFYHAKQQVQRSNRNAGRERREEIVTNQVPREERDRHERPSYASVGRQNFMVRSVVNDSQPSDFLVQLQAQVLKIEQMMGLMMRQDMDPISRQGPCRCNQRSSLQT